jgi:hypothetical protein
MEDSINASLMMKHLPRQKYHCKDYRTKVILLIIFLTIPTSVEAHKMHLQNKVTPKSCKWNIPGVLKAAHNSTYTRNSLLDHMERDVT